MAMDYNNHLGRQQQEDDDGEKRHRRLYRKITKHWDTVPVLEKKEIFVHARTGQTSFSRKGSIKGNLQDKHARKTKVNNL